MTPLRLLVVRWTGTHRGDNRQRLAPYVVHVDRLAPQWANLVMLLTRAPGRAGGWHGACGDCCLKLAASRHLPSSCL